MYEELFSHAILMHVFFSPQHGKKIYQTKNHFLLEEEFMMSFNIFQWKIVMQENVFRFFFCFVFYTKKMKTMVLNKVQLKLRRFIFLWAHYTVSHEINILEINLFWIDVSTATLHLQSVNKEITRTENRSRKKKVK